MRWRNYSLGLTLIVVCAVGVYLVGQSEEGGVTNSAVDSGLAAEKEEEKYETQLAVTNSFTADTANVEAAIAPQSKYAPSIVPENMTVPEKKQRFRALLVPSIDQVYQELCKQYEEVAAAIKTGADGERIESLKNEYRAETTEELLAALKPHPPSIALAQAAMESAWGTSRFFIEANNVFGVWSFDNNEPRIAAGEKRGDKTIWLKKYDSTYHSVKDYYRTLARGGAFKEFRALRMETNNPYELVEKLDRYSEKGDEYGKELASMIRFNKFGEYDDALYER